MPPRFNYDLVSWTGGQTAYLTCGVPDMTSRIQDYAGSCYSVGDLSAWPEAVNVTNTCAVNNGNGTHPYTCSDSKGVTLFTTSAGVAEEAYRKECEWPCDLFTDCNAICVCAPTCAAGQYCLCNTCKKMYQTEAGAPEMDATRKAAFQKIMKGMGLNATQLAAVWGANVTDTPASGCAPQAARCAALCKPVACVHAIARMNSTG